jgi:integrase
MKEQGQETFERVADHFYKRQYQTAGGEWRTKYSGIFVDWTGKRRKFALGTNEKAAREALSVLWGDNLKRVDFDAQKEIAREKGRRTTLAQWAELYFAEMVNPSKRSIEWERTIYKRLEAYFGPMFLDEIDEAAIDDYRDKRRREPVTKHKKPVKGTRIAYSTVNRELAILRILLRLAKRKKKIKLVPDFNLQSEKQLKRSRIVPDDEYQAILSHLARHWQRAVIGLNETAMRVNELLKLTWLKVDEKAGLIRLKAADVKEKAPRVVPISPALQAVLDELKLEQKTIQSRES